MTEIRISYRCRLCHGQLQVMPRRNLVLCPRCLKVAFFQPSGHPDPTTTYECSKDELAIIPPSLAEQLAAQHQLDPRQVDMFTQLYREPPSRS